MENENTIFHITHWKAGSQWVHKILRDLLPERIVAPKLYEKQFLQEPLRQGFIYPTVYVTREQFFSVKLPQSYKKFVIIRDLRDTLVSGYFSIRYSHALLDDAMRAWREKIELLSLEEGLLLLIDEWLPYSATVQASWVAADEAFIRYEDLLSDDLEILTDVLLEQCKLNVSPELLCKVIEKNRFRQITDGRNPGEENIFSHQRKGVAGDWKNYFTANVVRRFDELYGELSAKAGYERLYT